MQISLFVAGTWPVKCNFSADCTDVHAGTQSTFTGLPGMYADLDFEALKSVDELLVGHKVYLAAMGADHEKFEHGVPNAWMASVRGHPFWLFCLQQVIKLNAHRCGHAPHHDCLRDYVLCTYLLQPVRMAVLTP